VRDLLVLFTLRVGGDYYYISLTGRRRRPQQQQQQQHYHEAHNEVTARIYETKMRTLNLGSRTCAITNNEGQRSNEEKSFSYSRLQTIEAEAKIARIV
jgi:hypothetical protein